VHPADAVVRPLVMRHLVALLTLIVASTTIGNLEGQRRTRGDPGPSVERVSLAGSMLAAHNAVRQAVGVPALTWSVELATFAQQWANQLVARGQFAHRRNSPYGENLYEITGARTTPSEVVDQWASESKNYRYGSNTCRGVCGHYTQIVWRDTRRVGCAVARTGRTEVWVCNYDPPGNWIGKRPY
jgi:pathogenesis-related protein 1